MISRLIIKYHGKVYSIPISHYTCEDVEHWGDHLRIKPYFSSDRLVVEALYSDLLKMTIGIQIRSYLQNYLDDHIN